MQHVYQLSSFNSLSPGKCGSNLESMIFQLIFQKSGMGAQCDIAQNFINEMSTLV